MSDTKYKSLAETQRRGFRGNTDSIDSYYCQNAKQIRNIAAMGVEVITVIGINIWRSAEPNRAWTALPQTTPACWLQL